MRTWKNLVLAGTMAGCLWLLPVKLLAFDCWTQYEACLSDAQASYDECMAGCDPAFPNCQSFCEQSHSNDACYCDVDYSNCEHILAPMCGPVS
jgi:hypothetical protein